MANNTMAPAKSEGVDVSTKPFGKQDSDEAKISDPSPEGEVPKENSVGDVNSDRTNNDAKGPEGGDREASEAGPAAASSSVPRSTASKPKNKQGDRAGSWSLEEEQYALYAMGYFDQGLLKGLAKGASLRMFLAEALDCDPMRISKKFTGAQRVGRRFFRPLEGGAEVECLRDQAEVHLQALRARWKAREKSKSLGSPVPAADAANFPNAPPVHRAGSLAREGRGGSKGKNSAAAPPSAGPGGLQQRKSECIMMSMPPYMIPRSMFFPMMLPGQMPGQYPGGGAAG
eukprot:CAMPEP_0172604570 /NCGR_PEP_ID=MMETSP1068-20121228/24827_1 /TAXON_ID=35684 /ORGANISM="Pseudopedinella elastica, Strain CCMP716" /LENGTH=285 /DNA_ID=CAMNT_0013406685 /DNA_START=1 /DNA_END=854 /DNA_ORIENTATION=-